MGAFGGNPWGGGGAGGGDAVTLNGQTAQEIADAGAADALERALAANEPTGFERDNQLTNGVIELSPDGVKIITRNWLGERSTRNDGTFYDGSAAEARQFAIHPVKVADGGDGTYTVWIGGEKHTVPHTQKVTFPNQSGLQYVYHNDSGTLSSALTFSAQYFERTPITAVVYGNAVDQILVTFGDERHGIQMDGATHRYLHFTQNTRYYSGMELQGVTPLGTTYTLISSGVAYDEDIIMSVPSQVNTPFLYRNGAHWTVLADSTVIAHVVTGAAQFNCDTNYVAYGTPGVDYTPSGLYELRPVTGNDRMIVFFCLTNDSEFPYVKILGQFVYSNSADALAAVYTAIDGLRLDGLPSPEFLPLFAVIVDAIGQVDDIDAHNVYVDLRQSGRGGTRAPSPTSIIHNDTTQRDTAGAHPAAAVTASTTNFAGLLSASDSTVQAALETLDNVTLDAVPTGTTNVPFTTTLKGKLDGIEAGADVNNISDVNATDLTDGGDSTLHYHASDRDLANATGTLAIENGGTNSVTAQAALNTLSGGVTSGQYLRGDGTNVALSAIQAGDVPTLNQNTSGTASNVTGTVAIANGGTGQTSAQLAINAISQVSAATNEYVLTKDTATGNAAWKAPAAAAAREILTAARTYYVRQDGNDSNTGLANTSGGAFATIQKAADVVCKTLDLGGYNVTISVSGTHTTGANLYQYVGGGTVTISLAAGSVISTTNANCFNVYSKWAVTGSGKLQTTTSGWAFFVSFEGYLLFGGVEFGSCASGAIYAVSGSEVRCVGSYSISGGAGYHLLSDVGAIVLVAGVTVTITNTPAFSQGFAIALKKSLISIYANTYVGTATGRRYASDYDSTIYTAGATLPGNVAGTTANGGTYY